MVRRKELTAPGSIREIIFGLEDSLVSTLGAVTGIAAGTDSTYVVVLSGLVLIAVESVSMAAGSYLSSEAARDVDRTNDRPLRGAVVMLVAYALGGMVPLVFYLLLPVRFAYAPSIIATVITLFLVGAWKGKLAKQSLWKSGLQMMSISIAAAAIGYGIGAFISHIAGVRITG